MVFPALTARLINRAIKHKIDLVVLLPAFFVNILNRSYKRRSF